MRTASKKLKFLSRSSSSADIFSGGCTDCGRLERFLSKMRHSYPNYHNGPVESFGNLGARLLIVGLAPGMHGANASGRPFTGDHAGLLLYRTLHEYGFSNLPESKGVNDNLKLVECRITNAVRCLPPQNKPVLSEVKNCQKFLVQEMEEIPDGGVIVALGKIAHDAVLRAFDLRISRYFFSHGAEHVLPSRSLKLLDSYHCSRYNTQTGRLTEKMFGEVFKRAAVIIRR